ncbi:hypothetical protein [Formosa sp. PL04]|uniref:hypothetical protein n=1 Tax=Formosa sp. PL04 TaxID=3081755 RepID=UPI0029812A9A|nr:hypothetical protein [Formosa sp. PL04]MDW5288747.1 hypothetical protein [Formosa sp. PL04]
MVKELHKRGYGNLRVFPSIAPNGLVWRCKFINQTKEYDFIASLWFENHENKDYQVEIKLSPIELADYFINENHSFIEHCKVKNQEYEKWFDQMVEGLKEEEIPYSTDVGERFFICDYWLTNKNKEIKTLLNEKEFYTY